MKTHYSDKYMMKNEKYVTRNQAESLFTGRISKRLDTVLVENSCNM